MLAMSTGLLVGPCRWPLGGNDSRGVGFGEGPQGASGVPCCHRRRRPAPSRPEPVDRNPRRGWSGLGAPRREPSTCPGLGRRLPCARKKKEKSLNARRPSTRAFAVTRRGAGPATASSSLAKPRGGGVGRGACLAASARWLALFQPPALRPPHGRRAGPGMTGQASPSRGPPGTGRAF